MLSPRLTNCIECTTITALLEDIECKIAEMANIYYNNIVFSLNFNMKDTVMMDLLNYKRILTYKFCNEDYAMPFTVQMIASRVKLLTAGVKDCCIKKKPVLINPTTTSTTSSSTSTTSTSTTECPCASYSLSAPLLGSSDFTFTPCGSIDPITISLGSGDTSLQCIKKPVDIEISGGGTADLVSNCCTIG